MSFIIMFFVSIVSSVSGKDNELINCQKFRTECIACEYVVPPFLFFVDNHTEIEIPVEVFTTNFALGKNCREYL